MSAISATLRIRILAASFPPCHCRNISSPLHPQHWRGSVTHVWDGVAIVEDMATAGSGIFNAAVFAGHALGVRGPRRGAALLLAALFAATAAEALARLGTGDPSALEVAARTPLLVANVTAATVLAAGA